MNNRKILKALSDYKKTISDGDLGINAAIDALVDKIENDEAATFAEINSAWGGDITAAERLTKKKLALNCPFCGKSLSGFSKTFNSLEAKYRHGIIHACSVENASICISVYSEDAEKVLNTWNTRAGEAGGCEFE